MASYRRMTSPDESAIAPASASALPPGCEASRVAKMEGNGSPHDRIFRHAFSLPAVARQFLRTWLPPEMVAQADWRTLEVCPVAGISETLAERRGDVVYRIRIAGHAVHFYVLIEHQTKIDRFMARRVLEEIVLIWQHADRDRAEVKKGKKDKVLHAPGRLPLVVPIVLHPGPGKWGKAGRLSALIDVPPRMEKWARTFVPDCGFVVVDLAGLPLEKLADGHLARAILGALQGERMGMMDIRKIKRLLGEMFADPNHAAAKAVINHLWHYLISFSELKHGQIDQIVSSTIPNQYRKDFMSTAELLRQEGMQKGRQESQQNSVIDVLEVRFGHVPEGLRETIRGIADLERLRSLHHAAIRCASIEVFSQQL